MSDQLKTRFHNLPEQLTPLIGREPEIQAVCSLLRQPEVRLVTLTGPGGVGKTRLGLQVATELVDEFADGICFVPLAPIRDPDLVAPTLAQTLGLKETGDQPLRDLLKASLQDKRSLLLLDNLEQIVEAAPAHVEAVQRYFFDQLSKDEMETMAVVFDRVLENLRREKT